jgi:hypothetical protein
MKCLKERFGLFAISYGLFYSLSMLGSFGMCGLEFTSESLIYKKGVIFPHSAIPTPCVSLCQPIGENLTKKLATFVCVVLSTLADHHMLTRTTSFYCGIVLYNMRNISVTLCKENGERRCNKFKRATIVTKQQHNLFSHIACCEHI